MMQQQDIDRKVAQLEAKVEWFCEVFRMMGFPTGEWMALARAAKFLGVSADTLKIRIDKAELNTRLNQPTDLKYGVHYRKQPGTADLERGGWEINVRAWESLANTPEHLRMSR